MYLDKKFFKRFILILCLAIVGYVAFIGVSAFANWQKIYVNGGKTGSPFLSFFDNLSPDQLKGEGDGRINILLLGVGGKGHPGGQLADTIIVASIDPKNKDAALLSIPRDLYVPIPGYGSGKINSAHSTGESNAEETGGGPALMKETISDILDMPIHYFLRIDFEGFEKIVDSLGGVKVNVDKAINDPYYPADNMIDYDPFYISVGEKNMNGKTALKYARSRETTSDFDRSRRQMQVIMAIKDKAMSASTILNPKKVNELLGILGNHIQTDISLNEIERMITLSKDFDSTKIVSKVLDTSADGPLTSTSEGGYRIVPKSGNFKEVQRIAHEIFSDPYLRLEKASISIENGTGSSKSLTELTSTLKSYGYQISSVKVVQETSETVIYDHSNGQKPFTAEMLSKRLKAKVVTKPASGISASDLTLVLGSDYISEIEN